MCVTVRFAVKIPCDVFVGARMSDRKYRHPRPIGTRYFKSVLAAKQLLAPV